MASSVPYDPYIPTTTGEQGGGNKTAAIQAVSIFFYKTSCRGYLSLRLRKSNTNCETAQKTGQSVAYIVFNSVGCASCVSAIVPR